MAKLGVHCDIITRASGDCAFHGLLVLCDIIVEYGMDPWGEASDPRPLLCARACCRTPMLSCVLFLFIPCPDLGEAGTEPLPKRRKFNPPNQMRKRGADTHTPASPPRGFEFVETNEY